MQVKTKDASKIAFVQRSCPDPATTRESGAAQVKTKGARKITFAQFVDALTLVAGKRGASLSEAARTVVAANGPAVSGTKADYVKFHDDKVHSAVLLPSSCMSLLVEVDHRIQCHLL